MEKIFALDGLEKNQMAANAQPKERRFTNRRPSQAKDGGL